MEPVRDPEGIEIEFLEWTGSIYGRKVLEIGCGSGRLIYLYVEDARLVAGVDPVGDKLAEAPGARPDELKTPLLFAQAQAEDLPFADTSFETVLLGWSL